MSNKAKQAEGIFGILKSYDTNVARKVTILLHDHGGQLDNFEGTVTKLKELVSEYDGGDFQIDTQIRHINKRWSEIMERVNSIDEILKTINAKWNETN